MSSAGTGRGASLDHGESVGNLFGGEPHVVLAEQEGVDGEEAARVPRQEDLHLVVDRGARLECSIRVLLRQGVVDEVPDPVRVEGDPHLVAADPASAVPEPVLLVVAPGHVVQLPHRQAGAQALAYPVHHPDRAVRAFSYFRPRLAETEGPARIDVVALVHAREVEQHQLSFAHPAPGGHRVAGVGLRAREHRQHHRRHLAPGRGQRVQHLALHFQLAHAGADDFVRALEPGDRDARPLVQAGHLRRRLLPADLAQDCAAVHDPGARRLERGLEAIAGRPVRPAGPELEPHVALEPPFRLQLVGDETGAVPVAVAREETRVLGDREGAREDGFALGIEVDEAVVVDVHRDPVRGRPLHRALALIPHAQVAAHVVPST